ncbi:amidohydrolase family protein [Pseudonocardia sp. GCM10023141]|uniref:amidohydrolase family protein n=1 Tax=Pseudonocardia sp. GCM10023141 TaxID=3252653 RepID=UPI00360D2D5B
MSVVLRDVEVRGRRTDVRVRDGRVAAIGALEPQPGEETVDGSGGALLPGLVDQHLHLLAMAAAARSTPCGPPAVRDRSALVAALAAAPADAHGWVRGVGYHETVAGPLDTAALDGLHADRPVRVQHGSGALWIVNGRAARLLGLAGATHRGIERDAHGEPTGRLWRADDWLRTRLPHPEPPDLGTVGATLSRFGITAVTDATPGLDPGALAAISGAIDQHTTALGVPLGHPVPPGVTAGPFKIVLADSGLPELDALIADIRAAHAVGRGVAVHCVTREALVLLVAALEEAGSHGADRIEHAALVPEELIDTLARRGLRVVTQPGFLADRGDRYLREVPAEDHGDLYRCRSLLIAGVPLALSSDAPYGPLDPWSVIAAAVHRRVPGDTVTGPAERLTPTEALAAYLAPADDPGGPPRRVHVGAPADLVLLAAPLPEVLKAPDSAAVRATLINGRRVHDNG